jgi:hypothetical protein
MGRIIPYIMDNKQSLKPQARSDHIINPGMMLPRDILTLPTN